MNSLQDQTARTRFINELDQNFCVSAGAGVGKTTAIVERIANFAEHRQEDVSKLVVVTFARAAAEELRVRARTKILERLRDRPRAFSKNVLSDLRAAFFGTIHSFCLRLVREEGHALGLPQSVDLLEGPAADEVWGRFCESATLESLEMPERELMAALRFLSFEDLLALARQLNPAVAERLINEFTWQAMPLVDFREALADSGGKNPKGRESTAKNQAQLREWLAELNSDTPFLKLPDFDKGSGTFKAAFRDELAPLAQWLANVAGRVAASIALGFREHRLDHGLMTYDDQILWCRKLLEDATILRRLRARGCVVILDEAQDTDAEMFSVLTEIARPQDTVVGDWPTAGAGPEAGRFCFVGDEQQAIYSERADLGIYRGYIDAYKAGNGGERLEFSVTMRCPRRVIDTVNAVFSAKDRLAQEHVSFRDLLGKPGCPEGETWLLPIEPAGDVSKVNELFAWECSQVARFLKQRGPEGLGVTGWNDVAVICPRHRWLATAAEVFAEAGLPARLLAAKQLQLTKARYSWPAALIHVLLNPWDQFERAGVMREIFGVSDVDLAQEKIENRRSTELARADDLLQRLSVEGRRIQREGDGTLSRFVDWVLGETMLEARLCAIGETPGALEVFRQEALQAECDGLSLREWSAAQCDRLQTTVEIPEEPGNRIQLLTSMKSKGLEWPVIIPLGLPRAISENTRTFPRVEPGRDGVVIHLHSATVDEESEDRRKRRLHEKWQREFYVTLTRAKSLLILPDSTGIYKASSTSFFALSKWQELGATDFLSPPGPLAPASDAKRPAPIVIHQPPTSQVRKRAAGRSALIPRHVLPHELGHNVEIALPPGEPATTTGGVEYGTWWHETMERYPWQQDETARAGYLQKAAANASSAVFGERAARELGLVAAFCDELVQHGTNFLTEMPFSHPCSELEWMEGVIDLIVVSDDGLWIVDWKTDRRIVGEDEADFRSRLKQTHSPQLEAYAEMLKTGMRRPVSRQVIYSTELGTVL